MMSGLLSFEAVESVLDRKVVHRQNYTKKK